MSLLQPGPNIFPSDSVAPESAPVLVLRSELDRANVVLEGLRFSPSADFFGTVVLTIEVSDGGASGRGDVLSANSSVSLEVTPINDPPEVAVTRQHRRSGGRGPLPILDVEVSDVDGIAGEIVTVVIVAEKGAVSVDPSSNTLISDVPGEDVASWAGVTVSGLLPDVRRALTHVWFVLPSEGWEGGSTVTFFATDGLGATGSAESVVVVSDPDVVPIITAVNDTFIANQGAKTPLSGLSVSDLVEDAAVLGGMSSPIFHVVMAAAAGGVGLSSVPQGLSAVPESETAEKASAAIIAGEGLQVAFGTPRSTLSFSGTLPTVNTALEAAVYLSANGSAGLGNNSILLEVARQGKTGTSVYTARQELAMNVQPVNQLPAILWNASSTDLELPEAGGFSLRGLGFVDSDLANGGALSVRLEVLADGDNIVIRSDGTGLEFTRGSADGVPSSIIAFRGNATSVAGAMSVSAIVLDSPGMPRALVPALRVTVGDEDGGETSQVVEVHGSHVNSPPEVVLGNPQRMTLKEGGVLERVGELAGIEINDADVEDSSLGLLEVNVTTSHRAVLEIQTITTSAATFHPVQTITTRSGTGASTVEGTFSLWLDLTGFCETCGVEKTDQIWHDAVANENDVQMGLGSGSETGESIQAKLEALPNMQALRISVHCRRSNSLSSEGGREWRVTFHGAPSSLPIMQAIGDSLTGDTPSVEVDYAEKGNSLSGSFALSLGSYQTELIPYDADAAHVAAALEALPSVTAVDVATPHPMTAQGGQQWMVTFFDALGAGGDIPLMEGDGRALDGRGATIQVVEAVRGHGTAEVWEVGTSAAHSNLVIILTLTGALQAKGFFKLGLEYGGQLEWTNPIYPHAVGSISDEDGGSWSFGGIPGRRPGESVEGRLLSLEDWGDLGSAAAVTAKRVDSANGNIVQWEITFVGTPQDLEAPSIESTDLTGAVLSSVVASTHNQVQGFFYLAYGNTSTVALAHDSSGSEIAAALNALDSLHSPDVGTGVVAATRLQGTTLEGGRRWTIALLSDPENPANLTATGTSTTGLSGLSARASASLVRRGGRGAILRLVDLGGATLGIPGYTTGERLTVRGKPEKVTSALASLSYSPRAGWNGHVDILFRANDGGFTGAGGAQSGWGMVSATVEAVNNPLELLWCGNVLGWGGVHVEGVDEDAPFRLVDYDCEDDGTLVARTLFDHIDLGGPGPGLAVHDPDGGASIIQVREEAKG